MCKKKSGIIITLFSLFFLIIAILFFFRYRIIVVDGNSMAPSFNDGELLIASKNYDDVGYSDVVVVKVPDYGVVIKRVAAVSGDTICISDEKLRINDLTMNNYHVHSPCLENYTLLEGELYILGDNYNNSVDSRVFGPVLVENILGVIHK